MKAIIVGCGRVGATMARTLDAAGHDVTIIDLVTRAFDRLPASFGGSAVRGDGTDEDTLRRAGTEGADIFLALTEGDNRNTMAAQLAVEALGVPRVYAKINDPVRADAYAELGIGTICRTTMMSDALLGVLGLPAGSEPSVRDGKGHSHPAHAPVDAIVHAAGAAHAGVPFGTREA
jgi:trk system potassium uptake protein TrkA